MSSEAEERFKRYYTRLDPGAEEISFRQKFNKNAENDIKSINLICTACGDTLKDLATKNKAPFLHKYLSVLLCRKCWVFYGDGNFSCDEDGTDKYCRWCGQGGFLYCCSFCTGAFCKDCIERNLGDKGLEESAEKLWACYLCKPTEEIYKLRAIADKIVSAAKRPQRERENIKEKFDELREQRSTRYRHRKQVERKYLSDTNAVSVSSDSEDDIDTNRHKCKESKLHFDCKTKMYDRKTAKRTCKCFIDSVEDIIRISETTISHARELCKNIRIYQMTYREPVTEIKKSLKQLMSLTRTSLQRVEDLLDHKISNVEGNISVYSLCEAEKPEENIAGENNGDDSSCDINRQSKKMEETSQQESASLGENADNSNEIDSVEICDSEVSKVNTDLLKSDREMKVCVQKELENKRVSSPDIFSDNQCNDNCDDDSDRTLILSGECKGEEQTNCEEEIDDPETHLLALENTSKKSKCLLKDIPGSHSTMDVDEQLDEVNDKVSESLLKDIPGSHSTMDVDEQSDEESDKEGLSNPNNVLETNTPSTSDNGLLYTSKSLKIRKDLLNSSSESVSDIGTENDGSELDTCSNVSKRDCKKEITDSDVFKRCSVDIQSDVKLRSKCVVVIHQMKEMKHCEKDCKKQDIKVKQDSLEHSETSHNAEEAEINRLLNLKSLDKPTQQKKGKSANSATKVKSKKEEENKPKLLDFVGDQDVPSEEESPVHENSFLSKLEADFKSIEEEIEKKRNITAKVSMLCSSFSESDWSDENAEIKKKLDKKSKMRLSKLHNPDDKKVEDEDDENKEKKKEHSNHSWRNDKLLKMKLSDSDTSDEEKRWNRTKNRESKKKEHESSSDDLNEVTVKKKRITRHRRKLFGSDSEDAIRISSSSDEDNSSTNNKRKRKSSSSSSDGGKHRVKKSRLRRIKVVTSDSDMSGGSGENTSKITDSGGKGRKNIRKLIKDDLVAEETKNAAKEEEERRKRIAERQKLYNELYEELQRKSDKVDKVVLDFDPDTKEELLQIHKQIAIKLKPHQVKGVKFMWDACFESLKRVDMKGSGCILAHCMGLGKTLQVIALVHTLLTNEATKVKTVLIVSPLSTVLNWVSEFHAWLKDTGDVDDIDVFELSKFKSLSDRMYKLQEWQSSGGVMILGYEMFRNLTNPAAKGRKKKFTDAFHSTLLDPGPDLIVCDEGHLLKNENSALSKAMSKVRTLRRIVLTGTPLQNNLKEYHCMVQFVKPSLLGTSREFLNRFVNPILNGQYEDSTPRDVKIMKRRAHVLHKMLEGSVQRFDYSVLTPFLPPKHEYVISISLTEVQIKLYKYYLENLARQGEVGRGKGARLFADYQALHKIWTHPRLLKMIADKKAGKLTDEEDDFINDESTSTSEESSSESSGSKTSEKSDVICIDAANGEEKSGGGSNSDSAENQNQKDWWKQFLTDAEEIENIEFSGKLVLLFFILNECARIGDKVLVFSHSLLSLDLIEYFLKKVDESKEISGTENLPFYSSWVPGVDYFRLDGTKSGDHRIASCKVFNKEDNLRARLFLISTRAGGLGINLCGANRVVIFDASWNPSHDVQSIFRIYRFGQKKPCYIYRFLAKATMEEKIYERQVSKLSLSCRVVDEQQIERHYNMADLQELYNFDEEQLKDRPTPILPKDRLLAEMLKEHKDWIFAYHEHDSLLENKEEEELNEEERKAAWEDYENEKKGLIQNNSNQVPYLMPDFNISYEAIREQLKLLHTDLSPEQLDFQANVRVQRVKAALMSQQRYMGNYNNFPGNLLQPNTANVFPPQNFSKQFMQIVRTTPPAMQTSYSQAQRPSSIVQNPACKKLQTVPAIVKDQKLAQLLQSSMQNQGTNNSSNNYSSNISILPKSSNTPGTEDKSKSKVILLE